MKVLLFAFIGLISCNITKQESAIGQFYVPTNINWQSPNSGMEEIDNREISSFSIFYFKSDSIIYLLSSTNELINDSITYGVETGFRIDKCFIVNKSKNEIMINRKNIYSVVKPTVAIPPQKEIIESFTPIKFIYKSTHFQLTTELTNQSKNRILKLIEEFE